MKHKTLSLAALTFACALNAHAAPSQEAIALSQQNIIIDSHIDVPYRLHEKWVDVTHATQGGDFDYPRAITGGLNAPFMSIYTPASLDNSAESTALANKMIDYVEGIVGRAPNKFAIAKSVNDVRTQFDKGLISLPLGMENGSPIQGDLAQLAHFYHRGIRYITLAHSQSNHIADSSYDIRRKWKGLSPFGKALVKEMNDIGIMIDISHVSDDAFYQVIDLTQVPVIASHSSLRKFTPGFERNMDDKMLKAIKENGGVVMINFGSSFISASSNSWVSQFNKKRDEVKAQNSSDESKVKAFSEKYRQNNPFPFANVEVVLDHIDHVVEVAGIDHVGIGSDFDGVGDSLPEGLKDVSMYPNLVQGLLDRGYSHKHIKQILGENFLRVWSQVEDYAQAH